LQVISAPKDFLLRGIAAPNTGNRTVIVKKHFEITHETERLMIPACLLASADYVNLSGH